MQIEKTTSSLFWFAEGQNIVAPARLGLLTGCPRAARKPFPHAILVLSSRRAVWTTAHIYR